MEQLGSAIGDTVCNIGEARDTALTNLGTLAAPPCDALHGGCRRPTGQEVVNQLGTWKDAAGGAIGTVASDVGTAIRPGCDFLHQACRVATPEEALRIEYGTYTGLYGGLDALTFGAESNLGQYAGLDNNQIHCMPEYQQGVHLGTVIGVALAARGALALARRSTSVLRPAAEQPIGGNGIVLRDGEGATPAEIAASRGGSTGGLRGTAQQNARAERLAQVQAQHTGPGPVRYRCWRCGQTTTNPDNVHLGHRNVPTSQGGNLEPVNTCLEGAACNLSAGNRGAPRPGMDCASRGSCGAPFGRRD